ncbi:MAG: DUF6051 family protein, partial [Deltaproteobacteria bacterium]|nr:DUF6051 family protein [Deltaproteobacteria bacterium]
MPDFNGLASLRRDVCLDADQVDLGFGLCAKNFTHVSQGHRLLKYCDSSMNGVKTGPTRDDPFFHSLYNQPDVEIEENRVFRYHLVLPENGAQAKNLIFLLHGFNERGWSKYLPWAVQLAKRTEQAVLMFPIAFHMNRAPKLW